MEPTQDELIALGVLAAVGVGAVVLSVSGKPLASGLTSSPVYYGRITATYDPSFIPSMGDMSVRWGAELYPSSGKTGAPMATFGPYADPSAAKYDAIAWVRKMLNGPAMINWE